MEREIVSTFERLTDQFYLWERRGRGWLLWPEPVELEPPFRLFFVPQLALSPDSFDDGRKPTFLSELTNRMLGGAPNRDEDDVEDDPPDEPEPDRWYGHPEIAELLVAAPPDLDIPRESAEQLLLALPKASGPVAFELVGGSESVRLLLACGKADEPSIGQTVKAYFPDVLVSRQPNVLMESWASAGQGCAVVADIGLAHEFMVPLRLIRRFDVDPLASIVAALADLREGESGIFQVLFERARHPWSREALNAVLDDRGSPFFIDAPEISALARQKMARPLFAAVLRIGVKTRSRERALAIAQRLTSALSVLADPTGNELMPLENGDYPDSDHEADLLLRRSRRSGMLLSVEELVSLVHLPSSSVRDSRLLRHGRKTKAAPAITSSAGASLGQNTHDGKFVEVRLSPEQRSRHMYAIGASGTGKSTLLLNLIRQDLENGEGLAVFDPHGDLVDRILGFVPDHRLDDVILIDPGDAEFPIGFNILSAGTELEQTLLASDLVGMFQRLSLSWGDQMTSVLGNAILAFLENERGGTLIDLRRFLVEAGFRKEVLQTVRDPEVAYFWEREFPLLRGRPQAPILTRLDTFLRPKPIRYMVAQQDSRLDLRRVMDEGRVLLCRLSHGAIGEENAYLLGTLLVSKLHQVAMSRQEIAEERRRPFYLYIDEFHHFVTESMAAILSGARKYRLGLILAHQELRQLQSRSADVLAAVIANPCTRVCFRMGDEDARLLAKGFSNFGAEDLQNLSTGEAICRVERAEFDFNLRTPPLPSVDPALAQSRKDRVVARTRERYGTPRAQIEAMLWPKATEPQPDSAREAVTSIVEAPTRTTIPRQPKAPDTPREPAAPPHPVTEATLPGRGGPQHCYLQELIRRWAEAHEWRATVEERVLDGLGNIDVALRKGGCSVACEIVVSSPVDREVQNLQKCLAAGYSYVAEVSTEKRRLGAVRALAKKQLPEEQFARVAFVSPEELFELLPSLENPVTERENTVRGYRVRVRLKPGEHAAQEERRDAVSAIIARALRRVKGRKM